jgi:bifunctional non-homologous end joining protein LigD
MLPTPAPEPFHRPGWVYERKEDGWRMLAYKDGARVRLVSRRGVDHTARFAEVASAIAALTPQTLLLDGELCVFDEAGVSQFHLLGDTRRDARAAPAVLVAFDVRHCNGEDLRSQPLFYRRATLETAIAGSTLVQPALRLDCDGFAAWDAVKKNSWEGLVAKDSASAYTSGRSEAWLKLKLTREGRFVVIGLQAAADGASALLLAARRQRRLSYVGRVECGTTPALVARLRDACPPRRAPACAVAEPRADVAWIEPAVVAEVSFRELMLGRLRDPVLRAVRTLPRLR